eukprot:CAMPEP_0182457536 /NCGR_PEP_ID=MMETSP1319-20130603/3093_1 /TAXON_ID=172717 /ORGANISM="Bolidomonas pacifica, Strain RCC208" /LENGTH=48 /DNA_ID= /DNA_START= /DNA_END= /DNA_ORIENTATION=
MAAPEAMGHLVTTSLMTRVPSTEWIIAVEIAAVGPGFKPEFYVGLLSW